MDGREHERPERRRDERSTLSRHLELAPEQRLRRGRAEADDHARPDQRDFGVERRPARADFGGIRLLVEAPLAARLPLEGFTTFVT